MVDTAGMQGLETRQFLHQEHRSAKITDFLPVWAPGAGNKASLGGGLSRVASEMLLLPRPDGAH